MKPLQLRGVPGLLFNHDDLVYLGRAINQHAQCINEIAERNNLSDEVSAASLRGNVSSFFNERDLVMMGRAINQHAKCINKLADLLGKNCTAEHASDSPNAFFNRHEIAYLGRKINQHAVCIEKLL